MATQTLRDTPDGAPIEYRRNPYNPVVLHLEHRVLRPDGTPYDDRWYRVSDAHLLWMQGRDGGTAIIDALWREPSPAHVHTRDCYDDAGPGAGGVAWTDKAHESLYGSKETQGE